MQQVSREVEAVVLPEADKRVLERRLLDASLVSPYDDIEGFLLSIYPVFAGLPQFLFQKLANFRNDPRSYGALLVRNLPIDAHLPPTPPDGRPVTDKDCFTREASELGDCRAVGGPFSYRHEHD